MDGKAILSNLSHRDYINFSYLGYTDLRIPVFHIRKLKGLIQLFSSNTLDSIVVVGRRDDPIEEIPYVVNRISAKTIAFVNAQTGADALTVNDEVFVQKTQMGGGSPIIRGFEANRVLLVVDGVRMNNAIYRNGHLQNSITLDNSLIEQIEVINGPGSLIYGSDALGGVVHYRMRDPKVIFRNDERSSIFRTNAMTRYASANSEKTIHLDFDLASRKWGSITSFSFADYGDLRAGAKRPDTHESMGIRPFYIYRNEHVDEVIQSADPNIQVGTAYSQIDVLQKLKYQPSDSLYFVLNFQYSNSSDIPRYDALSDTLATARDLKWAEWYYGPQKRLLGSLKTRILSPTALYNKATLIAAFQRIDEDRFKRKWRKNDRTFQLEDVKVYSFTADFDKYLGGSERHQFSYGLDASYNTVSSEAGNYNINKGTVKYNELTRYPNGGSSMTALGAYLNYRWKSRDSLLTVHLGGRFSTTRLKAKFISDGIITWPEDYTRGLEVNNTAPTWGAGLTWNSKDRWQLRLLAATAFRAPNIDDLGKIRAKNEFITMPNIDLQPERSINGEITLGKTFGQISNGQGATFHISGTAFYTLLEDAIVRRLGTLPDGSDTIIVDGDPHDVQQNFNVEGGYIYGYAGNLLLNIGRHWQLRSGINFTKGRVNFTNELIDTLTPFDHIPPLYGQTALRFKSEKWQIEAVWRYNGKKPVDEYAINNIIVDPRTGEVLKISRDGTADNWEVSANCKGNTHNENCLGALAWNTFNFYLSHQLNDRLQLNLGLENILDYHYRPFASAISGSGRNFIIALRGQF